MKISTILHALKILLGITEQVTEMISDTKIPKEQQPHMHEEMNLALSKLHSAKDKIEIDPAA